MGVGSLRAHTRKEHWENIKVVTSGSSYHSWDHRTERERLEMAEPRSMVKGPHRVKTQT